MSMNLVLIYSGLELEQNIAPCLVQTTYVDSQGRPMSGVVYFAPSPKFILDPDTNTVIVSSPVSVTLDNAGAISIYLYGSDDPDLNPNRWSYSVTEQLVTQDGTKYSNTYSIEAFSDTVLNLADAMPVVDYAGTPIVRGRPGPVTAMQVSGVVTS